MTLILLEAVLLRNYGWICYEYYDPDENENDVCKICYDNMKDKCVLQPKCKHKYHELCILSCITKTKSKKCPECSAEYKLRI